MKRIRKTKGPTAKGMQNITFNLRGKFGLTVFLELDSMSSAITNSDRLEYRLSFVPGRDDSKCSATTFLTWPEVLDYYHELMKDGA